MCLAITCFIAAVVFPLAAPELAIVSKAMIALAALAVALPTFEWGAVLDYRIQSEDGTLRLGHILRCLTMTVIFAFISAWLAAMAIAVGFAAFR